MRKPKAFLFKLNRPRRLLFLDDDPVRAEVFLVENPEAIWVQTAQECLVQLEGRWDEVHLDHDLGGEHFVDLSREDCGMEVVRWLCSAPRPHLGETRFFIHSHNMDAACAMVLQMYVAGYNVEGRPFGAPPPPPALHPRSGGLRTLLRDWLDRLRTRFPRPGAASARPAPQGEPPRPETDAP